MVETHRHSVVIVWLACGLEIVKSFSHGFIRQTRFMGGFRKDPGGALHDQSEQHNLVLELSQEQLGFKVLLLARSRCSAHRWF